MKKVSRISTLLFTIALVLAIGMAEAVASKYVSIGDIKEEVKDGWHQTYYYNGEQIEVSVEITVPDVEKIPIVRVKWPGVIQLDDVPAHAVINDNGKEGFNYYVESKPGAIFSIGAGGQQQYYEDGARAENSPLSSEEAKSFMQEKLLYYAKKIAPIDFQFSFMQTYSRSYKISSANSSGFALDYNKPTSEMGHYAIYFNQIFHGIPYVHPDIVFETHLKSEPVENATMGTLVGTVGSKDDYAIIFNPIIEDVALAEDVPLLPFSQIKAEFERLIESGYIRSVYKVQLEYVRLNNPDDLGNTYILMPAWVVDGIIMRSPKDPTPQYTDEEVARKKIYGELPAFVNAQTAKYYDPKDKSPTRKNAAYFTWDEVK